MTSLIPDVVISNESPNKPDQAAAVPASQPAPKAGPHEQVLPVTKRKRTKAKPYEQLKTVAVHQDEKKAAKKAAKAGTTKHVTGIAASKGKSKDKPTPVLTQKAVAAKKKAERKAAAKKVVQTKAAKASPKGASSAEHKSGVCSICHKPLSRHTSVTNGMGDVCARKIAMLPKGMTLEDHYGAMTVVDAPNSKDYMPITEAYEVGKKHGVSPYRLCIAYGGDRMLRPPLTEDFRIVLYKGRRFIPRTFVKSLKLLQPK